MKANLKSYVLLLLLFMGGVSSGVSQIRDFEQLCEKYKHVEGVHTFRLRGVGCFFASLFVGGEETEIGTLIRNCSACRILLGDGGKGKEMSRDIKSFLGSSGLEELVSVKDRGKEVKVYAEGKKEMYRQFFIAIEDSSEEVVLLHVKGKFYKATLQNLMKVTSR